MKEKDIDIVEGEEEAQNDNIFFYEDEEKFTSAKILGFSFRGERYDVKDWAEMFKFIIRFLHSENSSIFYSLAKDNKYKKRISTIIWFNHAKFWWINKRWIRQLFNPIYFKDIEKGKLFYNATNSTSAKLQMLKDYFEKFDISKDELVFEIDMVESWL